MGVVLIMKTGRKFTIKFNGKNFLIKDYRICSSILSKTRGLMFRRKNYSKPLLFVWKSGLMMPIHSFFCRKFMAVWMLDAGNKITIVDEKIVEPFKSNVIPGEKFNLLLEVPLKYFEFADEKRKL